MEGVVFLDRSDKQMILLRSSGTVFIQFIGVLVLLGAFAAVECRRYSRPVLVSSRDLVLVAATLDVAHGFGLRRFRRLRLTFLCAAAFAIFQARSWIWRSAACPKRNASPSTIKVCLFCSNPSVVAACLWCSLSSDSTTR
jgi:hypothetical protein